MLGRSNAPTIPVGANVYIDGVRVYPKEINITNPISFGKKSGSYSVNTGAKYFTMMDNDNYYYLSSSLYNYNITSKLSTLIDNTSYSKVASDLSGNYYGVTSSGDIYKNGVTLIGSVSSLTWMETKPNENNHIFMSSSDTVYYIDCSSDTIISLGSCGSGILMVVGTGNFCCYFDVNGSNLRVNKKNIVSGSQTTASVAYPPGSCFYGAVVEGPGKVAYEKSFVNNGSVIFSLDDSTALDSVVIGSSLADRYTGTSLYNATPINSPLFKYPCSWYGGVVYYFYNSALKFISAGTGLTLTY